ARADSQGRKPVDSPALGRSRIDQVKRAVGGPHEPGLRITAAAVGVQPRELDGGKRGWAEGKGSDRRDQNTGPAPAHGQDPKDKDEGGISVLVKASDSNS